MLVKEEAFLKTTTWKVTGQTLCMSRLTAWPLHFVTWVDNSVIAGVRGDTKREKPFQKCYFLLLLSLQNLDIPGRGHQACLSVPWLKRPHQRCQLALQYSVQLKMMEIWTFHDGTRIQTLKLSFHASLGGAGWTQKTHPYFGCLSFIPSIKTK